MKKLSRLFIVACCCAALAPIAWNLLSSLKSPAELALVPPDLLPQHPTLSNYAALFRQRPFLRYGINSVTISTLASVICIACASLAAYRLARIRGRWRTTMRLGLLVAAFFPPIVFIFPVYELVRALGLVNHPWGLIFPYSALNLPFAIWLLTGSFEQIPIELEEAAAVDGLTRLQTLFSVILPVAAPSLLTAGLLVFIFSWNEFMLALTLMTIESQKTVTIGVATLSGAFAEQIPYGQIAAGVIASSLPLILLVVLFQRRIVAGLTAGALK